MPSNNNTANGGGRRSAASKAPVDSTYGHLQPQALELERVVLGALMIDKDAFTVVSEMLRPDTFYEPRNQKVYTAIQTLNMAEKPVDIMTVTEELRHEGELQNIGGPGYIVELSSHVASSAHIEYHARILQQKYLARQLISFASMVETEAFDETVDVDALMQKAEGGLFELSQRNMMQDYTQIDPVIKQAHDILLKAANNTGGLTGVPTGYTKLDEMTAGWQQSDLIIIAGRPAMGKTSFALSIAKNIAIDYRKPVAFFSLEMNNVQLINRLISNVCEVPGSKILSGQLSEDEWVRFDKRLPQMQGAPLYVDDTPGLSVFELRTKARRLKREHDIQLLMIDYLQLMNANGMRFNSRQEEVSTISRSLKGLAKELDIPIIECADYMETSALGRAEWMRFYGRLVGRGEQADSLFRIVEREYQRLSTLAKGDKERRSVLPERKTGSTWYLPGGRSSMGLIYRDAHISYAYASDTHSGSLPLSFETVLDKAGEADIWLMSFQGHLTKSLLLAEYAGYEQLRAFKEGRIYGCPVDRKPYFEEVSWRPDWLLRDLIVLFHPALRDRLGSDLRYYQPIV